MTILAPPERRRPLPILLLLLFFCSGLASLVYEVTWLKLLAGSLSNTSHALSLVLAAFLAGLAVGARWCARHGGEAPRPLRSYARLEMGVAALALLQPFLLRGVSEAAFAWLPPGAAHGLRLLLCGACIFVATLPMGATFPLQVASFRPSPRQAVRAASFILVFQTAGGMTGVILSGFLWLPAFGILNTHYLAVVLSTLVAAAAFVLSNQEEPRHAEEAPEGPADFEQLTLGRLRPVVLVCLALVGGASLALEVLYTRILSFFLPDLAWSFSAMLAVYLLALAVGAGLAQWIARRGLTLGGLGMVAVLGGALAIASLAVVPWLFGFLRWFENPSGGYQTGPFMVAAFLGSLLLVAPPAVVLASFLPLGIGVLAPGQGASPSAGRAYGWNSVGSAAGALLAGMALVPWVGLKGGVLWVGGTVLVAGAVLAAASGRRGLPGRAGRIAGLAAVALVVLAAPHLHLGRALIEDSAVFQNRRASAHARKLVEAREGSVTVASVVLDQERPMLFNDAFQAAGTGTNYHYMKMLGHLPMVLHERPERVVIIAFGTGTTAGSVTLHGSLRELTLVEISPEVLALAPHFEAVNRGLPGRVPDGIDLDVVVDDGRAFLRRTDQRFDVLTLEPLMPNTPAAAHFYTQDFFELARQRLREGGVLCHWIPLHGQPLAAFQAMLRSFCDVFPQADVYVFGRSAVLLGWKDRRPAWDDPRFEARVRAVEEDLAEAGVLTPAQVLGAWLASGDALGPRLAHVPMVTDDRPHILYPRILPNYETLRYFAESLEFLLEVEAAVGQDAPPGTEGLGPALGRQVAAAHQTALRQWWELAGLQRSTWEAYRAGSEEDAP